MLAEAPPAYCVSSQRCVVLIVGPLNLSLSTCRLEGEGSKIFRAQTKLREGDIFTPVCDSVHREACVARGACMAKGGGMHCREGHAWGREHAWGRGACI